MWVRGIIFSFISKTLAFVYPVLSLSQAPRSTRSITGCAENSIPPDVDTPAAVETERRSSSFCQAAERSLTDVHRYVVHTDTYYPHSGCSESLSVRTRMREETRGDGRPHGSIHVHIYGFDNQIALWCTFRLSSCTVTTEVGTIRQSI